MQSEQCLSCARYWGNITCEAYKERIPDIIFTGQHNHDNAYKNDNGIRYKPKT